MSKIKNGVLNQYGAGPFEQQQFGTAGIEGVKTCASFSGSFSTDNHYVVYSKRNALFSFLSHAVCCYIYWQLNCCGVDGPPDYLHSAWFNHTTFASGAFVPPSCCVLLNNDPRRPVYRDETQCQIEAILSINGTVDDDANVKTRVC